MVFHAATHTSTLTTPTPTQSHAVTTSTPPHPHTCLFPQQLDMSKPQGVTAEDMVQSMVTYACNNSLITPLEGRTNTGQWGNLWCRTLLNSDPKHTHVLSYKSRFLVLEVLFPFVNESTHAHTHLRTHLCTHTHRGG